MKSYKINKRWSSSKINQNITLLIQIQDSLEEQNNKTKTTALKTNIASPFYKCYVINYHPTKHILITLIYSKSEGLEIKRSIK